MISVPRRIKFPNKSINNIQRMKKVDHDSRFIGGLKAQCCIYPVCPLLTIAHRLLYIDFVHNLNQDRILLNHDHLMYIYNKKQTHPHLDRKSCKVFTNFELEEYQNWFEETAQCFFNLLKALNTSCWYIRVKILRA